MFIDVPIEELRRRDPKNLYKKAMEGKIKNVYGVDLKAEYPKNPDIHLLWSPGENIENMMDELLRGIIKKKDN